jgi:hypothetical protein
MRHEDGRRTRPHASEDPAEPSPGVDVDLFNVVAYLESATG